jgi:hypothetical protein
MMWRVLSGMAVCGLVILLTVLNLLAAEQPAVAEVLKRLNLSGYSSSMRPPTSAV